VFALNSVFVVTSVPPVEVVYQPTKMQPLFVGVGKDASFQSAPVVPDVGLTVPLFALNVIVYLIGVHRA
jgi:hypothetical protein